MTENWGEILGKWGSVWISDEFELSEFELSGLVLLIINVMPSRMVVTLITRRGSISRSNDTAVSQIKRRSWLVKYEWSSCSSSLQVCKQASDAS